MEIIQGNFGKMPDGREVTLFTLINGKGLEVDITNYGGTITALRMPDKHHEPGDVVLGFDSLEEYLGHSLYFGAIIGRYGNRINEGAFELDGITFNLVKNNGSNHLHGGTTGFDKVLWNASTGKTMDNVSLILSYESPHMEEGYPGNLSVEVQYTLNDNNELAIAYRAKTDRKTHVNLTNHSYFNLNNGKGSVLDHDLMLDADKVTSLNERQIPTGDIVPVEGTPYDFRAPKKVGKEIDKIDMGYDINYVVNDYSGDLKKIAALYHEGSGRSLELLTSEPGVQLYTGNYIDGVSGKNNTIYHKHGGLCLETQHFPDTPNQPSFPSTLLLPGEEYNSVTIFRFKW